MKTIYKDYLGPQFVLLSAFARHRVAADAPLLGGMTCPALDYTRSVSDDAGASYRNPTEEEKSALREEAGRFCYDCGDAQTNSGRSVILACGHVAHRDCHVADGKIVCPYSKTVDPERVGNYEEILPAAGGGAE